MGPDERGQPAHVSFEHTLMDRKLQVVARQYDRVLVVVVDMDGAVAVDVVCVLLLQHRRFDRFLESLVGLEMVPGAVRDGPV